MRTRHIPWRGRQGLLRTREDDISAEPVKVEFEAPTEHTPSTTASELEFLASFTISLIALQVVELV